MRRQRLVVIVSAALFGLILTFLFGRFDVNRYHSRIQSEMEQQLNRKVTLGDVKLRLFPPRLYVKAPAILEDPNFGSGFFIKADSMFLSVQLRSLITNSVKVDAVDWQRPQVQLVKNARDEWNVSSLGLSSLTSLTFHDGRVALVNLQKKENRTVYDHVDISVRNYIRGQPFSIDAVAHVSNRSDQKMSMVGRAGPLAQSNVLSSPFDGTLTLSKVPIDGLKNIFDLRAFGNAAGIASGKTTIKTKNGKVSAVGSLKLESLSGHGVDLGYPVTLQYTLVEDRTRETIEISSATVDLGTTPISVSGSVNLQPTPPELNLNVRSGGASAAEVSRVATVLGVGFAPDTAVSGQLVADLQIRGSAQAPALNGTVAARNLDIAGKEIPQPVQISAVDLVITPSEIRSNDFEIKSGKSSAVTRFALTQYLSKSPAVNGSLGAVNAELMDIRSIMRAYGAKGLARISGSGTISLQLYAQGAVKAMRSSEIVRLLSGNASLNLSNVNVTGTKFSEGALPKINQPIEVQRVNGHFVLNRGNAQTSDLRVILNVGSVAARGVVNLESETLNLRATVVLTREASKHAVGGGPANGILTAVLTNNNGELVVPGVVTGTLDNPKFDPDKQQMELSRLKGILPTSQNPAVWIESLLGHSDHHKQSNGATPSIPNPAKGIESVLGHILGGKNK